MILQGLAGMPLVVDSCLVMPDRYELVVEQLCRKLEDVHAHASVWYRPPQGERVYYTMRVDATITCFISIGCLMMLLKSTCSYILLNSEVHYFCSDLDISRAPSFSRGLDSSSLGLQLAFS